MIFYSATFDFVIEMIGIMAGLLVVCSFLFRNIRVIRIVNIFAAITFVVYGVFIKSYAVVITNSALILIQLFYLFTMNKKIKELKNNIAE